MVNQINNNVLENCAICFTELGKNQPDIRLHGEHLFHYACAERWFATQAAAVPPQAPSCPLCRAACPLEQRQIVFYSFAQSSLYRLKKTVEFIQNNPKVLIVPSLVALSMTPRGSEVFIKASQGAVIGAVAFGTIGLGYGLVISKKIHQAVDEEINHQPLLVRGIVNTITNVFTLFTPVFTTTVAAVYGAGIGAICGAAKVFI